MLKDLKKIVTHSGLYGVGNTLAKLSGLILLPFFTSYLPVAVYGLFGLLESISIVILALSSLGLRNALPRWYWIPEKAHLQKELFYSTVIASILLGTIVLVGAYFLLQSFSNLIFTQTLSQPVLWCFMGSMLFKQLIEIPLLSLRVNQNVKSQTIYQGINLALTVVFTLYFLKVNNGGLENVFKGQMIAGLITFVILIPELIRYSKPTFLKQDFIDMMRFGLPLALSTVLSQILSMSDRFILNYFINLEEVGTFTLATRVSNVLQMIVISSFLSAYTHIYYQGMNNENSEKRIFMKMPLYFTLFILFCGLIITLFGKEIIVLSALNNPEYWTAMDVLPLLVLGLIIGGIRQLYILDLSYQNKTMIISFSIVLSGVINILLNLLFIPFWNSIGAAFATALTQIIVSIYLYYQIKRSSLIPSDLRKIVIPFIAAIVITLIAISLNTQPLWIRAITKIVLLAIFPVILLLTGVFNSTERQILLNFWKKWKDLKQITANFKTLNNE